MTKSQGSLASDGTEPGESYGAAERVAAETRTAAVSRTFVVAPEVQRRARTVLVVGGLVRLAPRYRASITGIRVVLANRDSLALENRMRAADAVVVIPGNVSHQAARKVREYSRRHGLRLLLAASPGVGEVCRTIERASRLQRHR